MTAFDPKRTWRNDLKCLPRSQSDKSLFFRNSSCRTFLNCQLCNSPFCAKTLLRKRLPWMSSSNISRRALADDDDNEVQMAGKHALQIFLLVTALFSQFLPYPASAAPKRILLLHSFGRDFAPWNGYSKRFRSELDRRWSDPVDIYEASLVTARFGDGPVQEAFAEYLRTLAGQPLDLIVSIGAPAARFLQKFRPQISQTVPILYTALEERGVPSIALTANDTAVAIKIDFLGIAKNILQVLPETANVSEHNHDEASKCSGKSASLDEWPPVITVWLQVRY